MLINNYPVEWKDALRAELLDLKDNIYILVDGVHNESFYRQLKNANRFCYVPLYSASPSADEETLGLGPILVQYTTDYPQHWDSLIELTNGLPALSVIVSPESIEELAERLIPWCVVDADGYLVALSFADTRVLPILVGALNNDQRAQFLGPAQKWLYPGRDAGWLALPLDPVKTQAPARTAVLTAQQVAELITAAEADTIIFQLSRYASKPLSRYAPFDAHTLITRWLELGNQMKIDGDRERLALCEFGVGRPGLLEDPRYLTLLESTMPIHFEKIRQILS